jgi:hypothetical protein
VSHTGHSLIHGYREFFPRASHKRVNLYTHLRLVPRLKMSGVTPTPRNAFTACKRIFTHTQTIPWLVILLFKKPRFTHARRPSKCRSESLHFSGFLQEVLAYYVSRSQPPPSVPILIHHHSAPDGVAKWMHFKTCRHTEHQPIRHSKNSRSQVTTECSWQSTSSGMCQCCRVIAFRRFEKRSPFIFKGYGLQEENEDPLILADGSTT